MAMPGPLLPIRAGTVTASPAAPELGVTVTHFT